MSALGHKQTFPEVCPMSALPPKADIGRAASVKGQKRTFNDASIAGDFRGLRQINTSSRNLLSVEGAMIDALFNVAVSYVAVFAVLVLYCRVRCVGT